MIYFPSMHVTQGTLGSNMDAAALVCMYVCTVYRYYITRYFTNSKNVPWIRVAKVAP